MAQGGQRLVKIAHSSDATDAAAGTGTDFSVRRRIGFDELFLGRLLRFPEPGMSLLTTLSEGLFGL